MLIFIVVREGHWRQLSDAHRARPYKARPLDRVIISDIQDTFSSGHSGELNLHHTTLGRLEAYLCTEPINTINKLYVYIADTGIAGPWPYRGVMQPDGL